MGKKSFSEIVNRLQEAGLPKADLVVGIANGGVVPAYLISEIYGIPLDFIKINFRDSTHRPFKKSPEYTGPGPSVSGKTIIIVDDRVNSGKTMALAKKVLKEAKRIYTVAVNGSADYSLFDEECFKMPWQFD